MVDLRYRVPQADLGRMLVSISASTLCEPQSELLEGGYLGGYIGDYYRAY